MKKYIVNSEQELIDVLISNELEVEIIINKNINFTNENNNFINNFEINKTILIIRSVNNLIISNINIDTLIKISKYFIIDNLNIKNSNLNNVNSNRNIISKSIFKNVKINYLKNELTIISSNIKIYDKEYKKYDSELNKYFNTLEIHFENLILETINKAESSNLYETLENDFEVIDNFEDITLESEVSNKNIPENYDIKTDLKENGYIPQNILKDIAYEENYKFYLMQLRLNFLNAYLDIVTFDKSLYFYEISAIELKDEIKDEYINGINNLEINDNVKMGIKEINEKIILNLSDQYNKHFKAYIKNYCIEFNLTVSEIYELINNLLHTGTSMSNDNEFFIKNDNKILKDFRKKLILRINNIGLETAPIMLMPKSGVAFDIDIKKNSEVNNVSKLFKDLRINPTNQTKALINYYNDNNIESETLERIINLVKDIFDIFNNLNKYQEYTMILNEEVTKKQFDSYKTYLDNLGVLNNKYQFIFEIIECYVNKKIDINKINKSLEDIEYDKVYQDNYELENIKINELVDEIINEQILSRKKIIKRIENDKNEEIIKEIKLLENTQIKNFDFYNYKIKNENKIFDSKYFIQEIIN